MVKHPWPLLEISLSDFRRLATLNMITYLPTYLEIFVGHQVDITVPETQNVVYFYTGCAKVIRLLKIQSN